MPVSFLYSYSWMPVSFQCYAYVREKMRKTGGLWSCMLADTEVCFATAHIRISPCVSGSVGAWVCYCDILNPSLSSVRSSAAGASGPLIYLPGLCCWAQLRWSWLAVITKPRWEDTPHWFRADLWGVEKWRIRKCGCACVGFIDEFKLYFGYCVTFEWFMHVQRGLFMTMTHKHVRKTHARTVSSAFRYKVNLVLFPLVFASLN